MSSVISLPSAECAAQRNFGLQWKRHDSLHVDQMRVAQHSMRRLTCWALAGVVAFGATIEKSYAQGATTVREGPKVTPFEFNGDVRSLPQVPLSAAAPLRPYRPRLTPPSSAKRA